ncbi:sugar-binding protein [Cerasicoccus frondis]|uniref:sugar-binding protein n=1 Tax=Cerasicoccus frondis TaxID=490090 RepID=UPI002852A912|nr:sugar-binding protein [Cerasicoccus frondis]
MAPALAGANDHAAGEFTKESIPVTIKGETSTFEYLKFLPEDYADNDQDYPLILFLHGAGNRGADANELRDHYLPVVLKDKPGFPAIVLAPQCHAGGWWSGEQLDKLNELLLAETEKERVDLDRVYLTGLSMGGYGTWDMMRAYPDWFAAFLSVCGGRGKHGMENFAATPGWAIHGLADTIVPAAHTEEVVEAFRAAGGDIEMTLLPGVGHDAWLEAYDSPKYILWLLNQHRRDPDFVYEPDAKTQEFFERWQVGEDIVNAGPDLSQFPIDQGTATVTLTRNNPTARTVGERIHWRVDNPHYEVTPQDAQLTLPAGGTAQAEFTIRFTGEPNDIVPYPVMESEFWVQGETFKKFTTELQLDDRAYFARIARRAKVPQTADVATGGVDLGMLLSNNGQQEYPDAMSARVSYSEEALYVSIRVFVEDTSKLRTNQKNRDASVYHDDNVQLFLQPDTQTSDYFHIIVNPAGVVMDGRGHDRSWNGDFSVETQVDSDSWTVSLVIPWSTLGMAPPRSGDVLGFQLAVDDKQRKLAGQWSPSYGWGHQPTRFGRLVLE